MDNILSFSCTQVPTDHILCEDDAVGKVLATVPHEVNNILHSSCTPTDDVPVKNNAVDKVLAPVFP